MFVLCNQGIDAFKTGYTIKYYCARVVPDFILVLLPCSLAGWYETNSIELMDIVFY